jgi:hypothetical protein
LDRLQTHRLFSLTECADDPRIAHYHNPKGINFYIHHMRLGWPFAAQPRGIAAHEQVDGQYSAGKKSACLNVGLGRVNMFSEADEADFESAREAGITVVHFGAVGDAKDVLYLVDGDGEHSVICEHTINRLAAGIQRAADHGIKVIIALGHLPGRIFAQDDEQYDFRLWCSPEYGDRFAALWGTLARDLRHFENVVGYDLLNEPFTPDAAAQGYFDEMLSTYVRTSTNFTGRPLRQFTNGIPRPRSSSNRPIGRVRAHCNSGRPMTTREIVYSFHMYVPPTYTLRGLNRGRFAYPGPGIGTIRQRAGRSIGTKTRFAVCWGK